MTTINNIPNMISAITGNSLTVQGTTPASAGLFDFLNLLFTQLDPQSLAQSGTDLSAKIAGMMNLLPPDQAAKLKDLLQKMATEGQTAAMPGMDDSFRPTLTADLSQANALSIQNDDTAAATSSIDDILATANSSEPTNDLAEMLNAIEPEAGDIDTSVLDQLKAKFGNLTDISKLKQDAVKFLQEQGLDRATMQKALNEFLNGKTDTTAALTVEKPVAKPEFIFTQLHRIQEGDAPSTALSAEADTKTKATHVKAGEQPIEKAMPANMTQTALPKTLPARHGSALLNLQLQNDTGVDAADEWSFHSGAHDHSIDGIAAGKAHDVTQPGFSNYVAANRLGSASAMQMISLQIQKGIASKADTMTLQLTPVELGQLEIRMKFEKDGSIKAHMIAEKPETLALLQKDQHVLQRTLEQAGIDVDDNSLSFDLRQQAQHEHAERDNDYGRTGTRSGMNNVSNDDTTALTKTAMYASGYITRNGVNIMV